MANRRHVTSRLHIGRFGNAIQRPDGGSIVPCLAILRASQGIVGFLTTWKRSASRVEERKATGDLR